MKSMFFQFAFLFFVCFLSTIKICVAQENISELENLKEQLHSQQFEIQQLKQSINNETSSIKSNLNGYASSAMLAFLFGAFCALWAQNTNRNPWIWFFLGALFSVLTILFLLHDNDKDIKESQQ